MKPATLGTVWTARAKLYNTAGKLIGTCTDTPNAIAKALIELPAAQTVKTLDGYEDRADYKSRMWQNTCPSGLRKVTA